MQLAICNGAAVTARTTKQNQIYKIGHLPLGLKFLSFAIVYHIE